MTQNQMNEDLARALLAELKATMVDKKIWPEPGFDHLEDDPNFASTKLEFEQEVLAA